MPNHLRCPECSPTNQLNHTQERVMDIFSLIAQRCIDPLTPQWLRDIAEYTIVTTAFNLMRQTGVIKERPLTPDIHVHHRTRVIADELARRGQQLNIVTVGGKPTNFFSMRIGERTHTFEGLPGLDPSTTRTTIDDKGTARALFQKLGSPTPRGETFARTSVALAFAKEIEYPVVAKPHDGSLSAHTFINIQNEQKLRRAIKLVKQIRHRFIIEEYIPGSLYRATTVGGKLIACGRRDPPFVIGDGVHTIQELFESRDADRHAMLLELGYKKEEIPPLPPMTKNPATILRAGEKLELTWKLNVAYGATVTDVTDEVHPDNKVLFEKIGAAAELPCIGIDFIAPSVSVSWRDQQCGFIELNSMPAIDLHYPPIIIGPTRDIAGALIDFVSR